MSRAASSRPSELPMRVQDTNRMSMVYTTPQRLVSNKTYSFKDTFNLLNLVGTNCPCNDN